MDLDLRDLPLYSNEDADDWISRTKARQPDGLLLVLLDRQQHAWPTVDKALATAIPTVVFSPLGTSFTTNTSEPSKKEGICICSTDDFRQVNGAIRMINTGAKLRETRFLVIKGEKRQDSQIPYIGTKLKYIPTGDFITEYNNIANSKTLDQLTKDLIRNATMLNGPSRQDVNNGIRSYLVAKKLLEREKCDGITMDCLGALRNTNISLPCIAWSKMNDHKIPAACEADLGACVTHALVQYLFNRPGFQQDPVAETVQNCLIGSHCSCPTKLGGFDKKSENYDITVHHANRDATARTVWRIGQRITVADLLLADKKENLQMIISAGEVVGNKSIPPSGGCVVAPMVKLDNVDDILAYPGFHQIFFYGDYKRDLKSYCQLFGIKPVVV
jgi:L-fucose isomerase-like protein